MMIFEDLLEISEERIPSAVSTPPGKHVFEDSPISNGSGEPQITVSAGIRHDAACEEPEAIGGGP